MKSILRTGMSAIAAFAVATPALAAAQAVTAEPVPADVGDAIDAMEMRSAEVVQPLPEAEPLVQSWTLSDARQLLEVIEGIDAHGLIPADYNPGELRAAIAAGEGKMLDEEASNAFAWLIEDMRDGRTPMANRRQWFVVDPDADRFPTVQVMARALASHDIAGALEEIAPTHPDYAALKRELARKPEAGRRALIQANMDRWRWLQRDLGAQYLITNVPEYQLRLTVNDTIIETYRTVVGKPGRTATPQLAESVEGVIFNPTWTVPQSIVKGEGLGAKVLNNPAWARRAGYTATRGANGYVSVVQQPGPSNALGLMKLEMPNAHAIFLHDTPSRNLFSNANRALSHGCIRTERATELAITLAILQADMEPERAVEIQKSGEYTRVRFEREMPVYITYFTMGTNIDGQMSTYRDIYERDAPVLASFREDRVRERARVTDEEVIAIENGEL
ncbi:L,D-transpeptidase family protein [Alteriqipengyuania flavescens]|uniref:L,D-transpeptidase family protein n=1 Tax=Alteriqipengyuania flavescens TaxID=3053610 RepID=UPI0025B3632F|nr:L,D-transpeptidase family protein [Alteriqipengyuania flavescens]WJY17476.1 L,D-transpeptidase family protein [Alteriqipengyuania flavescens]WJY23419.1 L,D-transpeptidase family protein [Alteriqipengyuania flavescens]